MARHDNQYQNLHFVFIPFITSIPIFIFLARMNRMNGIKAKSMSGTIRIEPQKPRRSRIRKQCVITRRHGERGASCLLSLFIIVHHRLKMTREKRGFTVILLRVSSALFFCGPWLSFFVFFVFFVVISFPFLHPNLPRLRWALNMGNAEFDSVNVAHFQMDVPCHNVITPPKSLYRPRFPNRDTTLINRSINSSLGLFHF